MTDHHAINAVRAKRAKDSELVGIEFFSCPINSRKLVMRVESRGGIFFKPFANFQFDRMLQQAIIDERYLEGCYALGMQQPDLTASIYMVCSRGELQVSS